MQVTTTFYDGGSPLQEQVQYKYDIYSNVIEKDESAFYSCSGSPCPAAATPPGGWLRRTYTGYQYQVSSPFLRAHIVNKANEVLVTDGSGHPYSLTMYGYDESNLGGASGYTNHDDNNYPTGAVGLARGNVTSEHRCAALNSGAVVTLQNAASACANWLVTTHLYDLAGQVLSTIDPNGYKTSYSYADAYVDGGTGSPTDAYPTTVTYPDNLTDTYSYYYGTGQAASHTDSNGRPTNFAFNDNLNRLKTVTYPQTTDGTNGANGATASGTTTFNYTDTANDFSVSSATLMSGTTSVNRTTNYDGLGRVMNTELMSAYSGGASTVATTYDSLGRVFSVTNAYYTTADPTYGVTYYCYDAISRKVLQVQPDNGGARPTAPRRRQATAAQNTGATWQITQWA